MTDNQRMAAALSVSHRADGWWIFGGDVPMGPYRIKAEANEDRRGVQRFLRNCHRRGFITCDSPRRKK